MSKNLIYLPIESYESRSTEYMSCKHGVYETCFNEAGIMWEALRPWGEVKEIKDGIVVDYYERAKWGFTQVLELIKGIKEGRFDPSTDCIFFEDFWTPGFEMLPYVQSLRFGYDTSKHIKTYSFCHAQSTDPFDFTHKMKDWMRPMEKGWATYMSKVMCASKEMGLQWMAGGLPADKLELCGLSFNAGVMRRWFGALKEGEITTRQNQVVFSSRWDSEKNPMFFLHVAEYFAKTRPDVTFVICTGLSELKSNDDALELALQDYQERYDNVELCSGLSKDEYFQILKESKVQFNCASQDFVSYSLLDAVLNGCAPLYPDILTFPDALNRRPGNLYAANFRNSACTNIIDCVQKLNTLLDEPIADYSYIWKKYESSTKRKLLAMGFELEGRIPSLRMLNAMPHYDLLAMFKEFGY